MYFPGPNWPIFPNSFFIFVLGEMSTRPTTGSTTGLSLLFWCCTEQCGQHFSRTQKLSPKYFTENLKMLEWEDTIRIIVILVEKAKKIIVLPSRNWDLVCSFIAKLKWFFLEIWKAFERRIVFHGTFYFFFFHLNAVLKEKETAKTSICPSYQLQLNIFYFYWTIDGILKEKFCKLLLSHGNQNSICFLRFPIKLEQLEHRCWFWEPQPLRVGYQNLKLFEAIGSPFLYKKLNQSIFIQEQWAEGHMLDCWHQPPNRLFFLKFASFVT